MKKLVALVLAMVMMLTAGLALADAHPSVFKVEDQNGNVIYLFGTFHMVEPELYNNEAPFGPALEEAYAYADTVVVETDLLAAMSTPAEDAAASMVYTDGTTVLDHGVTEEMLMGMSQLLGVPTETLMVMKMDQWSGLLMLPAVMELGLDPQCAPDLWMQQRAANDGKAVIALESLASQEKALGMSDELMVAQIDALVKDPAASVDAMEGMYDAWLTGDGENLLKYMNDNSFESTVSAELAAELKSYNEGLGVNRDDKFFEAAVGYLANGDKVLISIGAAHIFGETGLVHRLTEAGYTVTDISR